MCVRVRGVAVNNIARDRASHRLPVIQVFKLSTAHTMVPDLYAAGERGCGHGAMYTAGGRHIAVAAEANDSAVAGTGQKDEIGGVRLGVVACQYLVIGALLPEGRDQGNPRSVPGHQQFWVLLQGAPYTDQRLKAVRSQCSTGRQCPEYRTGTDKWFDVSSDE